MSTSQNALRICKDCHAELPLTEFHFKDKKTLRYDTICKPCRRKRDNDRRAKPEARDARCSYMTAYNARPEVKERQRAWQHLPEVASRRRAREKTPERKSYRSIWWKTGEAKEMDKRRSKDPRRKSQRAAKRKVREMLSKYGMEYRQFLEIIRSQGNRCPICRRSYGDANGIRPVIDHCHDAGHVRTVICSACNLLEGSIRRLGGLDTLRRLLSYMESNELFYSIKQNGDA